MVLLGLVAGCSSGSTSGPTEPLPPAATATGELVLQVATAASSAEMFEVTEPSIGVLLVQANAVVRLNLQPGTYTFELALPSGLLVDRCLVSGGKRRTVTLTAGHSATLIFVVKCRGLPQ
jgi:hypothetical protein